MRVNKEARTGIIVFLTPAIILFLVFFVFPVAYVFTLSFYEWNGINVPSFAGIRNYLDLFSDKVFIRSIRNNLLWVLAICFIQIPLALLMAIILSHKPKGWKVYRTIYFLPQVISGVAIAALWSAIYNSEFGVINGILRIFGREDLTHNWLGDPKTALPGVMLYGLFYIGYFMVIIMAGLAGVDREYYEAARIDGASELQISIYVTLPLIRNTLLTVVTLGAIFGLRVFDSVYMLTDGGPANRTSVMVLYLFKQMQKNHYGVADASSVILILLGTVLIPTIRKFMKEKEA